MNAEEFVKNCHKEKQKMLKVYFDKEKETQVGNQIKNIISKGISNDEVKELINSVMNEVFYTMLLGLEGEASQGDVQMQYKVYDEDDNLLEGIESYAYDAFMDEEIKNDRFFPFEDAPNTATITCCHVIERNSNILHVSHDEEDGMWQFLCGKKHDKSEARIVSLYSIFTLDKSITQLADMPCGYIAERKNIEEDWIIKKC